MVFFFSKPFTIKDQAITKYVDTTPHSIWPGWIDMYWDHWNNWYDLDNWGYGGYSRGGWRTRDCGYK